MGSGQWVTDLFVKMAGSFLVTGAVLWWSGFGLGPLLVLGTACYFLLGGAAALEKSLQGRGS